MKHNLFTAVRVAAFTGLLASPFVANAAMMSGMGDNLASYDTNHDGKIEREELRLARAEQFDTLDRNHDGAVTMADLPGMMKQAKGRQFQMFMQTFDSNGDERVTRDEFVGGPTPGFDQADLDGNGVVDAAELKAFRSKN